MPELPVSALVPTAPLGTTSEGSGRIGPPATGAAPNNLPLQIRQCKAVVTKELSSVKSRLTANEDYVTNLDLAIVELQNRDEESKKEHKDHALRLQVVEARAKHLQSVLFTYLESQGVQIGGLGGATTMSELIVGNTNTLQLSAEESTKITEMINKSLASLYGVKKFSPKEHSRYPTVSKSHVEWPSCMENGHQTPLHRFKWDEAYNSPLNQPTFSAWVDHTIQQGPTLIGYFELSLSILNQKVVTSQWSKRYSAIKQQVMRYHGEKKSQVVGVKRRREGLDALDGDILGNKGGPLTQNVVDAGPEDQPFGNPELDGTPLVDPILLGIPAQAGGAADLPMLDSALGSGIPGSSNALTASEDIKPVVPDLQAKDFNSKANIRSRKATKLATCVKQRRALHGADEEFKKSKYNTYEVLGAMSKDKRVDLVNEKGEIKLMFISHAYNFLSQEAINCRDVIDRVLDPTKGSKKVVRQRGSLCMGPPPKAKANGGLQTWMIKPEVLVANPHWITEGRVYRSGPEWGEPKVKEQATHKPNFKKPKLKTNPNLQPVQQTEGAWLEVEQKYKDWKKSQVTGAEAGGSGSGPS